MNLLEKNKNYKPKNFSLSMGDWDEENCKTEWNGECGLQNIENGQYPFYINNTSCYKISDIPKQINTVNTEEGEFTKQCITGILTVKDGQIDLTEAVSLTMKVENVNMLGIDENTVEEVLTQ